MNARKLRATLAKLDSLAANPGTPQEGVAASAKAAELREKYPNLLFSTKKEQIQHEIDTFSGFGQQNGTLDVDFVDFDALNEFINSIFQATSGTAPGTYTTVERVKQQQKG